SGNDAAGTEAALEPSPGDSLFVKQIADVLAGHAHRVAGGAVIKERLWIADHAAANGINAWERLGNHAVRLSGDKVQRARSRGSKCGVEAVIAHSEVLGIIPKRRDRVAVKVAHHLRCRALGAGAAKLDELI